jgi:hypothetical protein
MDWGSARPFAVGWWAQADGASHGLPKGALVKYREWYGSTGEPNVGLRLTAEEVADGIKQREAGDDAIAYGVADPAIFSSDGGPSIAERMFGRGVIWRRADNARVSPQGALGGWDAFRQRLKGEDGRPMAYWMATCRDAILPFGRSRRCSMTRTGRRTWTRRARITWRTRTAMRSCHGRGRLRR